MVHMTTNQAQQESESETSVDLSPSGPASLVPDDWELPGDVRARLAADPPPRGFDPKIWAFSRCMLDVYGWLIENGSINIKQACEETGWPRWVYYRAKRDPYVAELALGEIIGIQSAAAAMVERQLLAVVNNMLEIATTEKNVAGVRAATWVREFLSRHKDTLEELVEEQTGRQGEKSAALLAMEQFPGVGGRFRKTETTTRQTTIEVEPDSIQVN